LGKGGRGKAEGRNTQSPAGKEGRCSRTEMRGLSPVGPGGLRPFCRNPKRKRGNSKIKSGGWWETGRSEPGSRGWGANLEERGRKTEKEVLSAPQGR